MSIVSVIARNLPAQKPQLWENLPRSAVRRLAFEGLRRLSPHWLDKPHVVQIVDGSRLQVIPRDAIGRAIYLYGMYEVATTKLIRAVLRPGDCFVDVGANVGYYSVLAGRRVGPSGSVHAFEPVSQLRARLRCNLELNALANAAVHESAVWSVPGELAFYESCSDENSGTSSVLPGPGRVAAPSKVPATTLDDFARSVRRPIDLVKIDVEGGEMAVFEGGAHLLRAADAPALVFETFDIGTAAVVLSSLGFEVWALHYSRASGVKLDSISAMREDTFAAYEAPNFLAAKEAWSEARGLRLMAQGPVA